MWFLRQGALSPYEQATLEERPLKLELAVRSGTLTQLQREEQEAAAQLAQLREQQGPQAGLDMLETAPDFVLR